MHEWPVSLTDDGSKEWRHMLGSAAFRSSRIKFCCARHAWHFHRRHKRCEQLCFLGLQAIETAWRSGGADVEITIDSILIVESNRALGLAPWGRSRGAHGAFFKQMLERYVVWLDISTTLSRSWDAGLLSRW